MVKLEHRTKDEAPLQSGSMRKQWLFTLELESNFKTPNLQNNAGYDLIRFIALPLSTANTDRPKHSSKSTPPAACLCLLEDMLWPPV